MTTRVRGPKRLPHACSADSRTFSKLCLMASAPLLRLARSLDVRSRQPSPVGQFAGKGCRVCEALDEHVQALRGATQVPDR